MWCTENYLAHNWVNHFKYMMSNLFIEKEELAKRKDFFSTWWPYGNTLEFKTENQGIGKLINTVLIAVHLNVPNPLLDG